VAELLITGLAIAFQRWSNLQQLVLDIESHGRESLDPEHDFSRSLGWFTSLYPVRLDFPTTNEPNQWIKQIKESLRAVPQAGAGYGMLRYLHADPAIRASLVPTHAPAIAFNYLGQLDNQQTLAPFQGLNLEFASQTLAPTNQRSHALELNCYSTDGCLVFDWECHQTARAAVEHLAEQYQIALAELLQVPTTTASLAPSDFPAARVKANDLDRLLARLKAKGQYSGYL